METHLGTTGAPAAAGGSNGKRIAFTILSGVFAATALGLLFGIAVVVAWFDTSDGAIHRVHDMSFGALFGVILAGGFAFQTWRPQRRISEFYQIGNVSLAAAIAGALAVRGFALVGVGVAVAYVILLLLHPYRSEVLHPSREKFSVILGGLTALGAIPLIWYALSIASTERRGPASDVHVKMDHWTMMAAMAIGIVLVGILAATRFRGWRISAWCAGVALALYGLISVVYPHKAGAEGTGWGLVALFGGLVFIAAAEWEVRRAAAAT